MMLAARSLNPERSRLLMSPRSVMSAPRKSGPVNIVISAAYAPPASISPERTLARNSEIGFIGNPSSIPYDAAGRRRVRRARQIGRGAYESVARPLQARLFHPEL